MRLVQFKRDGVSWIGSPVDDKQIRILRKGSLDSLIRSGLDVTQWTTPEGNEEIALFSDLELLPPMVSPGKIICIGLNYADHTRESNTNSPRIRQSSCA
jgi:acylpyruvate hydrolase